MRQLVVGSVGRCRALCLVMTKSIDGAVNDVETLTSDAKPLRSVLEAFCMLTEVISLKSHTYWLAQNTQMVHW